MVKNGRARFLLTNDDGVFAEGLQALRKALVAAGHETVVVAPERGMSGASRSLSLNRPLSIRHISDGQYAVDGTPTDCVMMAVHEMFAKQRPSLILSGINHGQNLADDVTYSGTCAAAAEGCMEGIPSVAISALPDKHHHFHFADYAEYFVHRMLPKILRESLPRWSFLNVNFPPRRRAQIRGVRVVPIGRSTYVNPIAKQRHPDVLGRPRKGWLYWITGAPKAIRSKGTDIEAVRQGYVALSPVRMDLNDSVLLAHLRRRFA